MASRSNYWWPIRPTFDEFPELYSVGRIITRCLIPIPPHRHPGWEICLIERGRTHWIIDGRPHQVRGGQVVVIPPRALHEGWEPGSYRWFDLLLSGKRGALGLPPQQARRIIAGLHSAAAAPRTLKVDLGPAFRRLDNAWHSGSVDAAISARAALLEILIAIVAEEAERPPRPAIVERAIAAFDATDDFLPIEKLAAQLKCSASHLKAVFRRDTGLPPAEYHRRQRLARAWRELLAGTRSVTEIAFAYGFPSSQHFATAFKRVAGVTPSKAHELSGGDSPLET